MDQELQAELRALRFRHYLKEAPETGCLEWTAARYKSGYGQFYWGVVGGKEKVMKASRAAWLLSKGEIPEALLVLHRCNNRACCNVEHLYLGTHADNMKDRDIAGNTSKGEDRYNFKRNDELIDVIKFCLPTGQPIADICSELSIGWTTFYRCVAADQELADLVKSTKTLRYTAARHRRGP